MSKKDKERVRAGSATGTCESYGILEGLYRATDDSNTTAQCNFPSLGILRGQNTAGHGRCGRKSVSLSVPGDFQPMKRRNGVS